MQPEAFIDFFSKVHESGALDGFIRFFYGFGAKYRSSSRLSLP